MLEQTSLHRLEAFIGMKIRCRVNIRVVPKELNVWSIGTCKFVVYPTYCVRRIEISKTSRINVQEGETTDANN